MKVRFIRHGVRARTQRRMGRRAMRRLHQYVRRARVRWNEPRATLKLVLISVAMSRREKRMSRFMKTKAYRKRADRVLALARRSGGVIVFDDRSLCGRVVANEVRS